MSLEHSPARGGEYTGGRSNDRALLPDRFINERECRELTNLSRVTRWRLMRGGEFPAKIRLSRNRTAWRLSNVLEWMSQREVA